jgi:hypothetical protein
MPITALPTPPSRADAANFNTRAEAFLGALSTFGTEANALATETDGYASSAAASAATAVNAPGTSATSTTSLAIGTGSKSLTVQTAKSFVIGQWVTITSTASPANYMHGQITAYTSGTGAMVVGVSLIGGTGTLAAWTVALSAPSGAGSFATLASPTFTGTPAAPTAAALTNTTQLATTAFVTTAGNLKADLTTPTFTGTPAAPTAAAATNTTQIATTAHVFAERTNTATLTNKTLTSPAINGGALDAASTISDTGAIATNSAGFRGLPQLTKTASYTLALTDSGKHISITTGGIVIPSNASIAFPIGTAIVLFNNSGSTQAITITTDTLRLAGSASTGSRTLAAYGLATCVKVAATTWVVSGSVT